MLLPHVASTCMNTMLVPGQSRSKCRFKIVNSGGNSEKPLLKLKRVSSSADNYSNSFCMSTCSGHLSGITIVYNDLTVIISNEYWKEASLYWSNGAKTEMANTLISRHSEPIQECWMKFYVRKTLSRSAIISRSYLQRKCIKAELQSIDETDGVFYKYGYCIKFGDTSAVNTFSHWLVRTLLNLYKSII